MKLTSPAFTEGGMIPKKYTCDGDDFSPLLAWSDVPAGARTLALICDDPDAPSGIWVHWVAFNLPPTSGGLPEGIRPRNNCPAASRARTVGGGSATAARVRPAARTATTSSCTLWT